MGQIGVHLRSYKCVLYAQVIFAEQFTEQAAIRPEKRVDMEIVIRPFQPKDQIAA